MTTTPATELVTVTLTKPQARYLSQLADAAFDYHKAVDKLRTEAMDDASKVRQGISGRMFRLGELGADCDAAIAKVQGLATAVRAVFPDVETSVAHDIATLVICNYNDRHSADDEIQI